MDYWQELVTGKFNDWITLSLLLPSLPIHWHVNSGVSPFTVPVKFLAVSNAAEMRDDILCRRHAFLRTVVSFIEHEWSLNSAGLLVLTAPIEICCDICITVKCARFITEMNVILYRQKKKGTNHYIVGYSLTHWQVSSRFCLMRACKLRRVPLSLLLSATNFIISW